MSPYHYVPTFAICVTFGMYHSRRRRRARQAALVADAEAQRAERRSRKKKKKLFKPKLYEVGLHGAESYDDLEALLVSPSGKPTAKRLLTMMII